MDGYRAPPADAYDRRDIEDVMAVSCLSFLSISVDAGDCPP